MITGILKAAVSGMHRVVSRAGEQVEATLADPDGRGVTATLDADGRLTVRVFHPDHPEAVWRFLPNGFYDLPSNHDTQRPRVQAQHDDRDQIGRRLDGL